MNVEELITELQKVKDKRQSIAVEGGAWMSGDILVEEPKLEVREVGYAVIIAMV